MTNAVDGLRNKFRFILIQIEKAKDREIAARRKTNMAIARTKEAEKKCYYLKHRCVALEDCLFINGLKLERTILSLVTARNLCGFEEGRSCQQRNGRQYTGAHETLEEKITMLEVVELEYNSDTAVLVAKKEMVLKRLEKLEEKITIANEEKKILDNRLLRSSEALRLKEMKRELDNEKRTSRCNILEQLERKLRSANESHRTCIEQIEQQTTNLRRKAEDLRELKSEIRQTKRELQRVVRRSKTININGSQ